MHCAPTRCLDAVVWAVFADICHISHFHFATPRLYRLPSCRLCIFTIYPILRLETAERQCIKVVNLKAKNLEYSILELLHESQISHRF